MGVLLDGLRDRRAFFVEQEYFHIDNGKSKKKYCLIVVLKQIIFVSFSPNS